MSNEQKVTRRTVLKAAAAAAVAPYFVSRSVLGSPGRASANNRINLRLIGVGNMGGGHVGAFLGHGDVQVVGVCDVNCDKRAKALPVVRVRFSADEMKTVRRWEAFHVQGEMDSFGDGLRRSGGDGGSGRG